MNIRPLLIFPKVDNRAFLLGKTALSFFNIIHAFFLIPFSVVLIVQGYDPVAVMYGL
jgi:hypothetical protein